MTAQTGLRQTSLVLVAVLSAILPAAAQLPFPELSSVFPPGAQAGTTIEVTIGGSELDEADALLFSHPGISCEPVLLPASEFYPERPAPNRFRVTVGADVPAGMHEFCARTRLGLTAPHAFVIGTLPEVPHAGDNGNAETPMPLPLRTVVNAHTDNEQIDHYRLELKEGQRVLIQCRAEQLDSRLDATLVLFDGEGRELARDRDTIGRDAVIDFTAPADGAYLLHVFDFTFGGSAGHTYRLVASETPHLDFVYPPAGIAGATSKFRIYGRNLPGGSLGEGVKLGRHELESIEVDIALAAQDEPARVARPVYDALTPGIEYRLEAGGLQSNALRIGFAAAPIVEEDTSADDQLVTLPCEVHGRFDDASDLDRYRFEAVKGTALRVECISERIRGELDPLLVVEHIAPDDQGNERVSEVATTDDAGGNPGGERFPVRTRDPFLHFTPNEDGGYRVTVLNQSSAHGPAAIYRLVIRAAEPDFDLLATTSAAFLADKQARRVPTILRAGGTAVYRVFALRRDGFGGDITLTAEGLPEGVICPPVTIRNGDDSGILVLKCNEDAPSWNGFLTIRGTAGETVREARAGTLCWPVGNWDQDHARTRLSSQLPLSVCAAEKAPLVVEAAGETRYEVELDGTLEIPVKLAKHIPMKGEIIVRPSGLPYAKDVPQLKLKESESEGKLTLAFKKTNEFPIGPGEWRVSLHAEVNLKYRNNPAAAEQAAAEQKRFEELEKSLQEEAQKLRAAVEPARNELAEAEKNVQSASAEAKADLEVKVNEARARLQGVEEKAKESDEKAKRAGNEKNNAANLARQAAERAKERDVKHAAYSLPITIVVKEPAPKEEGS